jgi:hypothetical protein
MAEAAAPEQHTLDDQYWRWHVIRECRVPDHYIGKATKHRPDGRHVISPALTKSVLLNLAKWGLDQTIYEGVEHMAHSTQAPVRTINDAMRVLVYHGLITRTERPSSGSQKNTTLNWDKIEALREAFMPKSGRIEPETASDKQPPMAALAARPAPAPPPTPAADKMQRRSVPPTTPAPPPVPARPAAAPVAAPAASSGGRIQTVEDAARCIARLVFTNSERQATEEMLSAGAQALLPLVSSNERFDELKLYAKFIGASKHHPSTKGDGSTFTWFEAFLKATDPIATYMRNLDKLARAIKSIEIEEERAQRERERTPLEGGLSQDKWDAMFDDLENSSE